MKKILLNFDSRYTGWRLRECHPILVCRVRFPMGRCENSESPVSRDEEIDAQIPCVQWRERNRGGLPCVGIPVDWLDEKQLLVGYDWRRLGGSVRAAVSASKPSPNRPGVGLDFR